MCLWKADSAEQYLKLVYFSVGFVYVMVTNNNGMRRWSTNWSNTASCYTLVNLGWRICFNWLTYTDEKEGWFCLKDGICLRDSSLRELMGSGWALLVIWKANRYQTYLLGASRYKRWQKGDLQSYYSCRVILVHLKWHQTHKARKAS